MQLLPTVALLQSDKAGGLPLLFTYARPLTPCPSFVQIETVAKAANWPGSQEIF